MQSSLHVVPHGVAACTTETSVVEFITLKDSVPGLDFSASYDPWEFVDHFGLKQLYNCFLAIHGKPASANTGSTSFAPFSESSLAIQPSRPKHVGFTSAAPARGSGTKKKIRRDRRGLSKSADEASDRGGSSGL